MLPEDVQAEVAAWVQKARHDFAAADILLAAPEGPPDVVAYHAQQGAEKSIKALLTAYGLAFPKTHDLDELVLLLPLGSNARAAVDHLADLSDAAVVSRYPGPDEDYDRTTAEQLLGKSRAIYDAAMKELTGLGWRSAVERPPDDAAMDR